MAMQSRWAVALLVLVGATAATDLDTGFDDCVFIVDIQGMALYRSSASQLIVFE